MSRGEDWSVGLPRIGILVSAFGNVRHNSLLQYYARETMIDKCQFNSAERAFAGVPQPVRRIVRAGT